jgi:membrane protein
MRRAIALLGAAWAGWNADNAPRLGAALAYYTLFSVAPLLVIAIAIAAVVFGEEAAQGRILAELRGLVGEQGGAAVQQMIESSRRQQTGVLATLAALLTLVLGATGVFVELRGALNLVWNVEPPQGASGFLALVRDRLVSLAMVMAVGFLLLVSLVVSALLAAAEGWMAAWLPGWDRVIWAASTLASFAVVTLLFALIFKLLPDTTVGWRDVWAGAAITAVLFTVGKLLIGLYLGKSAVASTYGAAGSVVVLVVWVYYAAQIFYFGAELTHAYARRHGSRAGQPEPVPSPARVPAAAHRPAAERG